MKARISPRQRKKQTLNPYCLAEFLRNIPDKLSENQRAFLAKEYFAPYCPDDMYANLEFICNEFFLVLSDAHLGALLQVQDWDPFILIENLCGYFRALDGTTFPDPGDVLSGLREIATALEHNDRECLGRIISLWFEEPTSPVGSQFHWQNKRYQFLHRSEVFKTELAQIAAEWPKELGEAHSRNVPQWWMFHNASSGSVLNYDMVPSDDYWGNFVYPEKFASQVQKFMIRWNIELMRMENGKLDFIPARVQCVTDVYGQGTYVFIPRYYNWSRIKHNEEHGDFDHVQKALDKTFKKFSAPAPVLLADLLVEAKELKRELQRRGVSKHDAWEQTRKHMAWSVSTMQSRFGIQPKP